MAVTSVFFCVVLYFNVICGYKIINDEETEIIWPTEYHFNGEKYDFETTLKEPFEIWYSADQNRSRIDFYGGSSKKYYYEDKQEVYSVYPMATSDMSSEMFCGQADFTEEDQVDFLPDVSEFTYTGKTMTLFDKLVDEWISKSAYEEALVKEEALYVYKTEFGVNIPVQHIIKIFNEELGVVDSHVVKNYYNFMDSVDPQDVSIQGVENCMYFGTLGKNLKNDMLMLHPDVPGEEDILFESYINHHKRKYHENEKQKRKHIFKKNWRMVHNHNRKNLSYKMELNAFSDRTAEELKYLRGTLPSEGPSKLAKPFPLTLEEVNDVVTTLPKEFDLRLEGAVSAVKNQGNCGSCWAFSATASLEGAIAKANGGRLMDLSEQSLVDCSWSFHNMGCDGGFLDYVWMYVYENGIPTEMEYGVYLEHNGICKIKNMTSAYTIKGFAQVTPQNPNAMKVALNKFGPVSVTVYASDAMLHYSSGIFYDVSCEGKYINHAVTVVGYGVRDGEEYWLVKNSYGEAWGEDGYILMSAKNNNCLLLDGPYYPIV